MGLLDDAIREHLELKRRHGADPSEVARQEHEALGPPRRGTAASEALSAGVGTAPAAADDLDEDGDLLSAPVDDDDLEDLPPAPARDGFAARSPSAGRPAVDEAPPARRPAYEPEDDDLEDPLPPSQPAGEPEAPVAPPASVDEPEERRGAVFGDEGRPRPAGAAGRAGSDAPAARDDVLEETPDFLQETPEHDRLWFEQKPPKDFDF